MRLLRLVPDNTKIDFVRLHKPAFAFTAFLFLVTIGSLAVQGFNLGIDFAGGILIEAKADRDFSVHEMRGKLHELELGAVELQQFGGPREVLIRVQQQDGGEAANRAAIGKVRDMMGPGWDYRRVELVGPKVGGELLRDGILATALALVAIGVYVAFRFEWQFGVAALLSTAHDVIVTAGLYSVARLEFDLNAVAVLLTLAGYWINDTVVVFDRMRETMRRNRSMTMTEIINTATNETLARTILVSLSTLLAIIPLLLFGGQALFNFTLALTFGVVLGTYSSIYVAASIMLYMRPVQAGRPDGNAAEQSAGSA